MGKSGGLPDEKAWRRELSQCWLSFLKLPFPSDVYKLVLVHMQSRVLPNVHAPLLLADFLTDSYNIGGVVSLLALNGLFTLMSEHNLEYPNFYPKLFQLCTESIFHAKYKHRFFKLVALFLRSVLLPSYLVAAFVKRFARLALSVPPAGVLFCLTLIFNLLRRHPSVRVLLHRPHVVPTHNTSLTIKKLLAVHAAKEAAASVDLLLPEEDQTPAPVVMPDLSDLSEPMGLGSDPYDHSSEDPAQCRALQSSLWEIKTLCNHYCPSVVQYAKIFFAFNAPKEDYDIDKFVASSYDKLFRKEMDWRKNQRMPLQYEKPDRLFEGDHEEMSKIFRF